MSIHHMLAWYPWRSEKGIRAPGTGVMDGYVGAGSWTPVLCKNSWCSHCP